MVSGANIIAFFVGKCQWQEFDLCHIKYNLLIKTLSSTDKVLQKEQNCRYKCSQIKIN